MIKHLSLRNKMIFGFSAVILLLAVVSIISWNAIEGSSEGFMKYRGLARDTNLSGRLQANMLMVRMNVKDFIITGSEKDKKQYSDYMKKTTTFLEEAKKEIQNPQRAAKIQAVDESIVSYKDGFKKVTDFQDHRNKLVNGTLNVKGPYMENTLTDILESARKDGDNIASYYSAIAMKHLLLGRLYMAKFLDTNDDKSVKRVHEEFGKMDRSLRSLDKNLQNPTRRKMLAGVKKAEKLYVTAFDDLVETISKRNDIITNTLDALGPVIARNVEDVKLSVKTDQDKLGPELQADNQSAVNNIVIVSVIAILVGFGSAFFLISSITKPFRRIFQGLKSFSNSELEEVRQKFEGVIGDLTDGGYNIATASQQISSGAAQQASSIEETTSSLEEMSGMVQNNVDNTEKAMKLAEEVNDLSASSTEVMSSLQESMKEILKSNDQIEELVKVIGNIGEKTQVMDEIVFQTKLLSFNASVEAERAGEHGRGFAVVAQEVGNLAQMSGKSAQEIAEIVKESIKNAELITSENRKKVEEGGKYVSESSEKFQEIAKAAVELQSGSKQVLDASKDQSIGISEINTAMQQVDKATQENSAATEELSSQAQNLKDSVNILIDIVSGDQKQTDARAMSPAIQKASQPAAKVVKLNTQGSEKQSKSEVVQDTQTAASAGDGNWEQI